VLQLILEFRNELKKAEQEPIVENTRSEASANKPTSKEGELQYTLQLASFAKIEDAKTYIEQSTLSNIRLKRGEVKGQKRFAVLTGFFSGYQAAKKASREIQEKSGITPWVRSIRDI
jgi:septal ring-binding cell division protein DamX